MIRDDFAGPGGWDQALKMLGYSSIGYEWDASACATALAAGHKRKQVDVREMRQETYLGGLDGYIASPPCQTFSRAGKGTGRQSLDDLRLACGYVAEGKYPEAAVSRANSTGTLDARSVLVLEPLLTILAHQPRWVALEQVPGVLPIWEEYADHLASAGYSVATGIIQSERYGVPQTRKRALLMAHMDWDVEFPEATHSAYHSHSRERLDPGVLPWVSMAEALGWGARELVGFPRKSDGRDEVEINGALYRARDLRPAGVPSQTVTEKARSWVRFDYMGDVVRTNGTVRPVTEPSATITASMDNGNWRWVDRDALIAEVTPRVRKASDTEFDLAWPADRPAPTIAGRGLVTMPGGNANRFSPGVTKSRNDGIRVTVQEAGVLQSFPADYPWQGTKTKQFEQVGNAIPVLMAGAILAELIGFSPKNFFDTCHMASERMNPDG